MDKFSWGAIVIAVVIEAAIVWYGLNNPAEDIRNVYLATALPIVLVGTVVLFHHLQKGET